MVSWLELLKALAKDGKLVGVMVCVLVLLWVCRMVFVLAFWWVLMMVAMLASRKGEQMGVWLAF